MIKSLLGDARSLKNDMIAEESSKIILTQNVGVEECYNCIVRNGLSTGYYNTETGKTPFDGTCPISNGNGKIESEFKKEIDCTYRYVSNNITFNQRIGVSTDTQYLIFLKKENIQEFDLTKRIHFEFNNETFEISENGIKNDEFRDYIRFAIKG